MVILFVAENYSNNYLPQISTLVAVMGLLPRLLRWSIPWMIPTSKKQEYKYWTITVQGKRKGEGGMENLLQHPRERSKLFFSQLKFLKIWRALVYYIFHVAFDCQWLEFSHSLVCMTYNTPLSGQLPICRKKLIPKMKTPKIVKNSREEGSTSIWKKSYRPVSHCNWIDANCYVANVY